jgi:ATP-dependent Clp protease ATP-binding subunit ClpC
MPGRAVKLLELAAGYSEGGLVTMNSVQQAIEKTMNIKVGGVSDVAERETLLNMESLIHERMINQSKAVSVVSDALRRARAGVRNPNRPIGTFLFLGPTGVGKTELAKAVAAVYFGGEDKIIRLDMNEFVRPDDVVRLIADGADDPTSLTAQAMMPGHCWLIAVTIRNLVHDPCAELFSVWLRIMLPKPCCRA